MQSGAARERTADTAARLSAMETKTLWLAGVDVVVVFVYFLLAALMASRFPRS
jgi:hypothetical protein